MPLDPIGARPRRAPVRKPIPILFLTLVVSGAFILTQPTPPAFEWTAVPLPDGANLDSLVATQAGFAVASGAYAEGSIWTSADGEEWERIPLPRAPTRVIPDGDDLLFYDARTASRISAGGSITELDLPQLLRTGYGSGRPGIVPGRVGLIAHSAMGDLYQAGRHGPFRLVVESDQWKTATDISFGSRCSPPGRVGPDLPPVISTPTGYVAFIAARDASAVWPICEPVPWTSADGSTWSRQATESPFGVGAYISDIAWNGDHWVAVGGVAFDAPALWISDDGLTWLRRNAPSAGEPYELVAVSAGPSGFIAIGRLRERPGLAGWASADGSCWETLPEEVAGRSVAFSGDRVLLTDRTLSDTTWLGILQRPLSSC